MSVHWTPPLRSIGDVVDYQMCTGCGVCVFIAPDDLELVDVIDVGRRPVSTSGKAVDDPEVLGVCPGIALAHDESSFPPGVIGSLRAAWGPVLAVWEGHASDPEIRFHGSSGGAATAIALFCIETGVADGALHTAADESRPYLNATRYSSDRRSLLDGAGSRYSPASPGDGLGELEARPGRSVFIGKPCDVAGVQKARAIRPALDGGLALTIGFFCAGTPSTRATMELLRRSGVNDPDTVTSLRYRGRGWPGEWTSEWQDGDRTAVESLSYEDSWGFLQAHRQWRCYICPDHTGEFADVAVGDPWYRSPGDGEPGRSLIVARTELGLETVLAAERAGYLVLGRSDPTLLPDSQTNLLKTRGRLWGQMLALRLARAPLPRYEGMPTFAQWWAHLDYRDKARSVVGTLRRVKRKRLRKRLNIGGGHDWSG